MSQKKVILVTGGSGLVGRAIQKITEESSCFDNTAFVFLSSADLDLTADYASNTRVVFETHQPYAVVHLAAKVGGLYKNTREKLDMYRDNMTMNDNLLRACQEFHVRRVVLCLSTCVFPDAVQYPFDESALHAGPPHPSNEGYAYAKRMLEVQARLYNEADAADTTKPPMQCLCVIPTNIYGAHDNFHLEDSHVIPGLIHRCYLAARDGSSFVVRGSGSAVRQFIHASDVASCVLRVALNEDLAPQQLPHGVILAPPPHSEHTIRDVAEMIADAFELPHERIMWDTSYGDGQPRKTASNALMTKLALLPDDSHLTSLPQGIRETVEWFKTHFNEVRK